MWKSFLEEQNYFERRRKILNSSILTTLILEISFIFATLTKPIWAPLGLRSFGMKGSCKALYHIMSTRIACSSQDQTVKVIEYVINHFPLKNAAVNHGTCTG